MICASVSLYHLHKASIFNTYCTNGLFFFENWNQIVILFCFALIIHIAYHSEPEVDAIKFHFMNNNVCVHYLHF